MNKEAILKYLNCPSKVDEKTYQFIDECIEEVKQYAYFKAVSQKFSLSHQPLMIDELGLRIDSQDLAFYLQDCQECLVVACTLGIQIDRRIQYYEHINMAKAVVFDAVSSRYLEECCDQYEKTLNLGKHTFRFAPGYGDLPLALNIDLSKALQVYKYLGVTINDGGLFIPMKSMLGIIGLGATQQKSCMSCIRKKTCQLRKEGTRCYVKD